MSSPDLLDDADVPSNTTSTSISIGTGTAPAPLVPAPDENNQLTSTTSPVAADIADISTASDNLTTVDLTTVDLTTDTAANTTTSDLLDTTTTTTTASTSAPEPLLALNNNGDHSSLSINIADNANDNDSVEISPSNKSVGETSNSSQTSLDSNGGNIKASSSSPLATTLAASSSSSPKMTSTNSDDGMSSSQPPEQYENDFSVSSEAKDINNNPRHSSRRLWIFVAGAIAVVVLIAAIAGGTVASKNKSAATTEGGDTPSFNIPIPHDQKSQTYLFIESLLPDGGQSLWDPNSYQSRALAFVEETNDVTYTLERTTQRFVLGCIYHSTNAVKTTYTDFALGADSPVFPWLNSEGWLELRNECEWFGIECNERGQVESIDLHENLLTGSFPAETALLKNSLKILDIEENIIYNAGDEGLGWLGELTNLQELNIAKTSFQYDGIPPSIGKLVNLVELDCSYCLFFGPLRPEVFRDLQKLQFLYIGGNSYNSAIPLEVGQLQSLLYLYAEFSDIKGDLSFLQVPNALPEVFEMWVDKNPKLTGNLPSELGNLVTLASLSLTECDFYGPIPDTMGNLVNMKQLWLYGNRLSGAIPASLGNLTELDRLELEANDLSGEMPAEVCNIVYPRGQLEVLEADCQEGGNVTCDSTSCCTCCGPECAGQDPQTLREDGSDASAGSGGGTRNENNGRKQRRLEFVQEQRRRLSA